MTPTQPAIPDSIARSAALLEAAPPPPRCDGRVITGEVTLRWFCGAQPARWLARHAALVLDVFYAGRPLDWPRLDLSIPPAPQYLFDSLAAIHVLPKMRPAIRAAGGRVLVTCDEEFWNFPPWIARLRSDQLKRLERSLAEADTIMVYSSRMAERVRRFNPSVLLLPHALPPLADLPRPASRAPRPGIRVGWVGTHQHEGDLNMIRPAIVELLARRREVSFVLAGQCFPDWARALGGSPQIELHPGVVPLPDYYRWVASLALDVFVTPLVGHPFNSVKPCLKPLEAAGLGIPVCASKVGSYAEDLRHEQTALLAFENTPEAWLAALTRLVDDADLRADLSARGLAWAATRTIDSTGPRWAKLWGAS
jgi:glycosyltransferase involved in cell wall biosynthesis